MNPVCTTELCERAGRLTAQNGGFWPLQEAQPADGEAALFRAPDGAVPTALADLGEDSARVRSHCRFRNRGTEYFSYSGIKWMSSSTKRQCDRALDSVYDASGDIGTTLPEKVWLFF